MIYRWTILIIVVLLSAAGCKNTELELENANTLFPLIEGVQSITVSMNYGSEILSNSINEKNIAALIQGLQNATPSYIEDPEPSGQVYKVEMKSDATTQTYTVNDLRATDSLESSVKIYTDSSDGQSQAWELPSAWMRLLSGEPSDIDAEPLLYVSVNEDSSSVIVWSNRNMKRETVGKAIEDTLAVSGMSASKQLEYFIHWSDSQRFVVRFKNLSKGNAVQFRLDGVQAETGESFASKTQQIRNQAVLMGKPSFQGPRWINRNGEILREQQLESAVLIQPIWTNNQQQDSLLVYYRNDSQSLINLTTGDVHPINTIQWSDLEKGYGNEYGTSVLFSDRLVGGMSFVVKENRTLYSVRKSGEAHKLYVSEQPIYGIASSPDSSRIAILVSSDSVVGPSADLIVLNKEGKEIFKEKEVSYMGHSDGFLYVYPMTWVNDHTIGVPLRWKGGERFLWGKSYINLDDASIKKEADITLPNEAMNLLEKYTGEAGASEISRVLPNPTGEKGRYYAVQVPVTGSWLIDVVSNKVTWLGTGTLVQWNNSGEVVVWQSKQEETIAYIGLDH